MTLSEQVKQDQAKFLREQEQRLVRAIEYVQAKVKEALSDQGSPDHHAAKGQPPLRQSGTLLNSIKIKINGNSVEIYSDCEYGKFLEANHPWFLKTIQECLPEVQRIIFGAKHG